VRYRKEGIEKTTRQLIEFISSGGIKGMTLLDIGGGLGGIQHTLLMNGVKSATYVDASSEYVRAAKEEAERRGLEARIAFLRGDFVELANNVPEADFVTLDRVICCYDNMHDLVRLSANKARKIYGLVFPRDLWIFRVMIPVANFFIRLTGSPFRIFIHRTEQVEKILNDQGLHKQFQKNAGFWQIMVYNRN
jgi:2-polyprenyl-3-methyl-5-hydroxy-6-metoxy-1,4-benzoquinol methylase